MSSRAWEHLRSLAPGDAVPARCYVLDYADGERPRWIVQAADELPSGARRLLLVDTNNGAYDLFDDGSRAALVVITSVRRTLRSRPHRLGGGWGNTLCDLDQQARAAGRAREGGGCAR